MKKVVLAFSGGLDTSFCVPFIRNTYQAEVHTVTVDCLGMSPAQKEELEARAIQLGAATHHTLDGVQALYDKILSYLIKGNVLRDRTYPLSVGAERYVQAMMIADFATLIGADAIAHGSTGAGNDQVRFDVALRVANPDIELITPIRDEAFQRDYQMQVLHEAGLPLAGGKAPYSINQGIWGTTIGGYETLSSERALPAEAYPELKAPHLFDDEPDEVVIGFSEGLPVSLNGTTAGPIDLLHHLKFIAVQHGVGRGMHTGDTILGIKGRIGFEAPVALTLYTAHRELEKLVLSKWQRHIKDFLSDHYGMLLHEAQYFDPVMRDIEAYLDASQARIEGSVTLYLYRGNLFPLKASSPYSLMNSTGAQYGEGSKLWTGEEARAFSKLSGIASMISNSHVNQQATWKS